MSLDFEWNEIMALINLKNMKKAIKNNMNSDNIEMPEHYDFDYSKAKPNRFAPILAEQNGFIKLEPEIQKVFKTSEQVNKALMAFIKAIPKNNKEVGVNLVSDKVYF